MRPTWYRRHAGVAHPFTRFLEQAHRRRLILSTASSPHMSQAVMCEGRNVKGGWLEIWKQEITRTDRQVWWAACKRIVMTDIFSRILNGIGRRWKGREKPLPFPSQQTDICPLKSMDGSLWRGFLWLSVEWLWLPIGLVEFHLLRHARKQGREPKNI